MIRCLYLFLVLPFLQPYTPSNDLQRRLWNAVSNGDLPLTKGLLAEGADPTRLNEGRTYLEIGAQNSLYRRLQDMMGIPNPYVPVIEALIECGADPKQINHRFMTPYEHYVQYVLMYPHRDIHWLLA
jgi:hypothetical protein